MTDAPEDDASQVVPEPAQGSEVDPRYGQRNFANRLFPGPTKEMSEQAAKRIRHLINTPEGQAAVDAWREKRRSTRGGQGGHGAVQGAVQGGQDGHGGQGGKGRQGGRADQPGKDAIAAPSAPAEPTPAEPTPLAPTADDLAKLQESIDQQNELLRAILSTQVDTQTDSRSTAQNSRTFAWAGSVIAILTLVATIISVVAAIQGH